MAKRTASTKSAANRKSPRSTAATKPTSKSSAAKKTSAKRKKVADEEVTIDRRTRERRAAEQPPTSAIPLERREKVNRRRQIDPTTCERDYTDDEVEFMNALDVYKRKNGRMFPTCSEVLEVIRGLGYAKLPQGMTGIGLQKAASDELTLAADELESSARELTEV